MVNTETLKEGDTVWCDMYSTLTPDECVVQHFDKFAVGVRVKEGTARRVVKPSKVFYTKEEYQPHT